MSWLDGSEYRGAWENDKRNGQGNMTGPDGRVYEGSWLDGMQDGFGVMIWP